MNEKNQTDQECVDLQEEHKMVLSLLKKFTDRPPTSETDQIIQSLKKTAIEINNLIIKKITNE
jgi:spore coat polysaccharide biosynthesis protein SpsF (cytidylyltransferase family)